MIESSETVTQYHVGFLKQTKKETNVPWYHGSGMFIMSSVVDIQYNQ